MNTKVVPGHETITFAMEKTQKYRGKDCVTQFTLKSYLAMNVM